MNVEQELWQFRAGQALLEAAMEAGKAAEVIGARMEEIMDPDYCTHPPFTKAGKHDKRKSCRICYAEYSRYNDESNRLSYGWATAWELLDSLDGESE